MFHKFSCGCESETYVHHCKDYKTCNIDVDMQRPHKDQVPSCCAKHCAEEGKALAFNMNTSKNTECDLKEENPDPNSRSAKVQDDLFELASTLAGISHKTMLHENHAEMQQIVASNIEASKEREKKLGRDRGSRKP